MHQTSIADVFETQRSYLRGFAYRMLGSVAEAEDIVQEAWLRWRAIDPAQLQQPRAFLTQTVAHLCIDHLKSARAKREVYVGPWLPEPIVEAQELLESGPDVAAEIASDVSYAFLLALENLSPLERAAFLLHDVFDDDFDAIAATLGRSAAACRQLASRARNRIRDAKPITAVNNSENRRAARNFLRAMEMGDIDALRALLADDVRLVSDGGGRVPAAGIPLLGRERVLKYLSGIRRKYPLPANARAKLVAINGQIGCVITVDAVALQTISVDFDAQDRIITIYIVRNPDKLKHVSKDIH